jgi:hypothetical protein
MSDYSINTIIFKNIIEYQYSASDEWWDALQLSHANDIQELVDISNILYKCKFINFENYDDFNNYTEILKKAKIIFNQYGYPIHMWTSFYSIQ